QELFAIVSHGILQRLADHAEIFAFDVVLKQEIHGLGAIGSVTGHLNNPHQGFFGGRILGMFLCQLHHAAGIFLDVRGFAGCLVSLLIGLGLAIGLEEFLLGGLIVLHDCLVGLLWCRFGFVL